MLSKNNPIQRDQLEMVALDQLVPLNHLVRKREATIDFSFIYDVVKDVYSEVGRPSIDPVILIKLTFIQYTFGIRSMHSVSDSGVFTSKNRGSTSALETKFRKLHNFNASFDLLTVILINQVL